MSAPFDPSAAVQTGLDGLTTNFATIAPIAIGVGLAPFAVRWLLKHAKSIGK